MLEIAEDRIADTIRHMKDVTTLDGKASEVNIKIVITPNAARDQFGITVSGAAKFSPREGAQSTLFAEVSHGEVEFAEYNPAQERMPFET
jgi:hypothetical protein